MNAVGSLTLKLKFTNSLQILTPDFIHWSQSNISYSQMLQVMSKVFH